MVSVAEWFRRKIVVLVYAGSNPVRHPITGTVVGSLERDRNSGLGSAGSDIFLKLFFYTNTKVWTKSAKYK